MTPDPPPDAKASLLVRPATKEDAATIAVFNLRMAYETEAVRLNPSTLERGVLGVFADPARGTYYVAQTGDAVIGCLLITHEWSDWRDGDMWWIQSVYVDVDSRRRGVFRAMFVHVESAARDAGAVAIRLYVEGGNAQAQAVYRSLGLEATEYTLMHKSL